MSVTSPQYQVGVTPISGQVQAQLSGAPGPQGSPGANSGINCDFRQPGTLYFTPSYTMNLTTRSAVNGGDTGYAISYTVAGGAAVLPFTVTAGQELAVVVAGLVGRISFSLR
jgi:hypothetical protein